MSKQAYLKARKLIRENGYFALRWMRMSEASIMMQLRYQREDALALRITDDSIMAQAHAYGY